jgi:magnesium-transporting ATPase (P-type)
MSAEAHHEADLSEKKEYGAGEAAPPKAGAAVDDDEDEDIDALIEELESQDHNVDDEEEEAAQPGGARTVPEELLQTSTRTGLSSADVINRRKKYGLNQMKEEKENLILKFLGFFIGPIQFVMEVSCCCTRRADLIYVGRVILVHITMLIRRHRPLPSSLPVFRIGSISVSSALFCCSMPLSVSSRNTKLDPLSRN